MEKCGRKEEVVMYANKQLDENRSNKLIAHFGSCYTCLEFWNKISLERLPKPGSLIDRIRALRGRN